MFRTEAAAVVSASPAGAVAPGREVLTPSGPSGSWEALRCVQRPELSRRAGAPGATSCLYCVVVPV